MCGKREERNVRLLKVYSDVKSEDGAGHGGNNESVLNAQLMGRSSGFVYIFILLTQKKFPLYLKTCTTFLCIDVKEGHGANSCEEKLN